MISITNDSYFPGVECGPYRTTRLIPSSLLSRFRRLQSGVEYTNAMTGHAPLLALAAAAAVLLLWNASLSSNGVEGAAQVHPLVSMQAPEPPRIFGGLNGGLSLGNGTEIKSRLMLDGHGELTIKNGTSYDAIVNLVEPQDKRLVRSFYVQSHKEFVEKNIAPGTYEIYFSTGKGWDAKSLSFQDDAVYGRFERQVQFSEHQDPFTGKIEFRGYEVSLQYVEGGDVAACLPVDKQTFQKMMEQRTDSAKLE
jgi:hypothetical protein